MLARKYPVMKVVISSTIIQGENQWSALSKEKNSVENSLKKKRGKGKVNNAYYFEYATSEMK